jgi:hypothetical protein
LGLPDDGAKLNMRFIERLQMKKRKIKEVEGEKQDRRRGEK